MSNSTFCYVHKIYISCALFHDAVATDNYTASNNRISNEKGQGYDIIEAGYLIGGTDANCHKVGQDRSAQIFHQSRSHIKVTGTRRVTRNKSDAADTTYQRANVKNTVARTTGSPGFVNSWVRYPMTGKERDSKRTSTKYKPKSITGTPTNLVITS